MDKIVRIGNLDKMYEYWQFTLKLYSWFKTGGPNFF